MNNLIVGLIVGAVVLALGFMGGWFVFAGDFTVGQSDYSTTITSPQVFQETATFEKDPVISSGTLTVTTSNTATSTIIGGCFQFYATSTATAHKFQASTTPGFMVSQYGTCPNL